MLNRDEALSAAAAEVAREVEYAGTQLALHRHLESPGFWVFYFDRADLDSRDWLAYRIPPIVVNRRTGDVTRPVAAAARLRPADLGPGEWFIIPEPEPRHVPHAPLEGLVLTAQDIAALDRLDHFRVVRAGRDDGDRLEAALVGTSPDAVLPGLAAAHVRPGPGPSWSIHGRGGFHLAVNPDNALVNFRLSGQAGDPWSFGPADIQVAIEIEAALRGAEWIRFWC